MISVYWDASALGKRYAPENGTELVNRLFSRVAPDRMFLLWLGAAEVVSIVVRRRNASMLSQTGSSVILREFRHEILESRLVQLESATDSVISTSLNLISKHNINATDAVVLRSAVDTAALLRANGDDLVFVASDTRLLRAAQAEGLTTFNPEADSADALDALLAPPQT